MKVKVNKESKPSIVPVEKLHFYEYDQKAHASKIFCHTTARIEGEAFAREIGVKYETIQKVLDGIVHVLRCGYEPVLGTTGEGVRFYPMLSHDYKTLTLTAQSVGKFRERLEGLHADCTNGKEGEVRSDSEVDGSSEEHATAHAKKLNAEKRICITPDTVVTCPKCGTEIRVGKCLCGEK